MKYELMSTRHAKYLLHAHLVFTPKYRKKIFTKAHFELMNEVFIDVCNKFDPQLVEFDGEKDDVHLLVLCPPRVAISTLVNSLKGVSSRMLRKNFDIFKKSYWGNSVALWSRSYFAASLGGAPIEILKQYIEQQKTPE
jgi:putative transposase